MTADASDRKATDMSAETFVTLRELSVVKDSGDSYIVGDAESGAFVRVPAVAAAIIADLQDGKSVGATRENLKRRGFADADVAGFVADLAELDLVVQVGTTKRNAGDPRKSPQGWLHQIPSGIARLFFNRSTWVLYSACLVFSVVLMVVDARFRPSYQDFFFYPDPAGCLAISWVSAWILTVYHELGHLVAARAFGSNARFTISRRFWFVVLETDLSTLWSRTRSQRIQAFLAGMAFDSFLLAGCLALRLAWVSGWVSLPPELFQILGLIVVLQTFSLGWQLFLLLRTDLYAVLMTALGCSNLYRVKSLYLKRKLGLLKTQEIAELVAADARDLQVARWFGWAYAVALVWSGYFLVQFFIPATVLMISWTVGSLSATPAQGAVFWEAMTLVVVATIQAALPIGVFILDRSRTRQARANGSSR